MIPTREQIDAFFHPYTEAGMWLRAMRDEIDRLTDANTDLRDKVDDTDGRIAAMEIHGNSADHWYRKATAYKNAFSERDAALAEVTKLRADLDRANTEAALARDAMAKATTDTRAKVQNELRSVERALCSADVLIKYAAWSRGAYECHVKNTIETAIDALRDDSATTPYSPPFEGDPKDCAFKTTPAPEREAAIRAWEEDATLHRCGSRFDDDDPRATYLMARSEITAAVALMRSADGKALLRELREDLEVYPDGIWTTREMVAKIGLLLAQSAPVEQPAAAVPDHFPDAGKMVPDDTRELVAQLGHFVCMMLKGEANRAEVRSIISKLRGGA